MKLLFSREWLKNKIKGSPDEECVEVGGGIKQVTKYGLFCTRRECILSANLHDYPYQLNAQIVNANANGEATFALATVTWDIKTPQDKNETT